MGGNERDHSPSHFHVSEAGRHLTSKVPTATLKDTIGVVRERLLNPRAGWAFLNYVYVLDEKGRLHGVASIHEVLQAAKGRQLSTFKKKNLLVAHPHSHLRHAAVQAVHAGVKAVPVIDNDGVFMGVITTDVLFQSLDEGHLRDILHFSGVNPEYETTVDVFKARLTKLVEWRTPWLVVGLFGGMLATTIVASFEEELSKIVSLAFFIPAMVYMGDAVGHQTQMLLVRGLALGHIRLTTYIAREVAVDVVMGAICACILYFFTYLFMGDATVATIVSLSLFLIMSTAGALSSVLSWMLVKLHRDPAIGGGPFATIIQDITSLLIYFAIASAFII